MGSWEVEKCEKCGARTLSDRGPATSKIIIIGDFPDWLDIRAGSHWSVDPKGWKTRAWDVMKQELTNAGLNPARCKFTNVWPHKPNKKCDVEVHKQKAIEKILGADFALLMGTLPVSLVLEDNPGVTDLSGLEIRESELPDKIRVLASVKATTALANTLGEVRLAAKNFAKIVRENEGN